MAAPSAGIRGWFRTLLVLGVFGFVCLIGGELFARLDDWWFADVPFLSTPSYNDLFMEDETRSPRQAARSLRKMADEQLRFPLSGDDDPDAGAVDGAGRAAGRVRNLRPVRIAQSRVRRAAREARRAPGASRSSNTGLPGITIHTLSGYWNNWVVTFRPQVAVVYPSTHLYMTCEDDLPQQDAPQRSCRRKRRRHHPRRRSRSAFSIGDLRLIARAKNVVELPDRVVEWRNERKILAVTSQHSASWLYSKPPQICVDAFRADLEQLIDNVQRAGTRLVLARRRRVRAVTPDSAGLRDLESFRAFSTPRAGARAPPVHRASRTTRSAPVAASASSRSWTWMPHSPGSATTSVISCTSMTPAPPRWRSCWKHR